MEENADHCQRSSDQVLCNMPIILSGLPSIPPELVSNMGTLGTLSVNRPWCLNLWNEWPQHLLKSLIKSIN